MASYGDTKSATQLFTLISEFRARLIYNYYKISKFLKFLQSLCRRNKLSITMAEYTKSSMGIANYHEVTYIRKRLPNNSRFISCQDMEYVYV